MEAQAFKHLISMMSHEAELRSHDASLLSSSPAARSDSASLLRLLALEILLKATVQIHCGEPSRTHSYRELFGSLPQEVRHRVLQAAGAAAPGVADFSNLDALLETFSANFVQLRYPYEKYEGLTEAEYVELGETWLASGGATTTADFAYHPTELRCLAHALQLEVDAWLGREA